MKDKSFDGYDTRSAADYGSLDKNKIVHMGGFELGQLKRLGMMSSNVIRYDCHFLRTLSGDQATRARVGHERVHLLWSNPDA